MIPPLLRSALIAAAFVVAPAAAQELAQDDAISRWIAEHARAAKGAELFKVRTAVSGDLDGDGRADAAVLYTLESGSRRRHLKYLAAFRRRGEGLEYAAHVLVGREGLRDVTRVTILGQRIELEVLEYQPSDAMCCPSRPARRFYRLRDGKLVPFRAP